MLVVLPPPCSFPLPSGPSRCVLRIVLSGCPFPSPAPTPFHAVCAFRGLGPVALQVRAACSLHVCVLVHPGRCHARTAHGSRAGRRLGRSRRFIPLRVFFPGPVLRLFSMGGDVTRSPRHPKWPPVARPHRRGPACRGRSGAREGVREGGGGAAEGGGAAPRASPSGDVVVLGLHGGAGGVRWWGAALHGPRRGCLSVPLPPLHGHQGWLPLLRIGHEGCGLHTATVRVRLPPPGPRLKGAVRGAPLHW